MRIGLFVVDPHVKDFKLKGIIINTKPSLTEQEIQEVALVLITTDHSPINFEEIYK